MNEYLLGDDYFYYHIVGNKVYEYLSFDELFNSNPVDCYELDKDVEIVGESYIVVFNGEERILHSGQLDLIECIDDTERSIKRSKEALDKYKSLLKQYK